MYRREFINTVAGLLRTNGIRKPVRSPKHVLHVSDDEGNHKDFVIKAVDRNAMYTIKDVENILDACVYVAKDALSHGDNVAINGFGNLGLKYYKPKVVRDPDGDGYMDIPARFLPRFSPGGEVRECAKIYEAYLRDKYGDADIGSVVKLKDEDPDNLPDDTGVNDSDLFAEDDD